MDCYCNRELIVKMGEWFWSDDSFFSFFISLRSGNKSEQTVRCSNEWLQEYKIEIGNTGTNPTLQYSDTIEQRLSIHLGLFTEESYTIPSINIYVLWSQVGLGWKTEAISALNICPQRLFESNW